MKWTVDQSRLLLTSPAAGGAFCFPAAALALAGTCFAKISVLHEQALTLFNHLRSNTAGGKLNYETVSYSRERDFRQCAAFESCLVLPGKIPIGSSPARQRQQKKTDCRSPASN